MSHLTKNKIAAYLALIFVAGAVSGAVLTWWPTRNTSGGPPTVKRACDHYKNRLRERLALTPEQMLRIEPILERTEDELRAIQRRTAKEVEQVIERSDQEIAQQLSDEQRAKLEEMVRERKEKFSHRFKPRPPK
jgi:Spy/CpxP family protein refolding chaperone